MAYNAADTSGDGARDGRGQLQPVLSRSDGSRNSVHALDDRLAARTRRRLNAVQRAAAWSAPDVAGAAVEAAEGPRSGRYRCALSARRRSGLLRIHAHQRWQRSAARTAALKKNMV